MKQKDNINFKNRIKGALAVVSLPALLLFIVGPLEIYAGNKEEFLFGVKDFIWIFLVICLVFWIIVSFIISIFRGKLYSIFLSIVFSISIMSYVQNMFLNKKMIDNAGNAMDWNQMKEVTIVNTIVWIIGILLLFVFSYYLKDKREKVISYISLAISAIQIVTIVSLIISVGYRGVGKKELVLSGEQQYQYASDDNIIILVLDAYSRDAFVRASTEYPELKDCLKDFTFYDNADCHYFYTVPSMLHMVTGETINFDNYFGNYKEEAWKTENCINFYDTLHKEGYTCRLYDSFQAHMYYGDLTNLQGKYDNFTYAEPRKDYKLTTTLLEKMTLYKYAPYIVKPKFEVMTYSFKDTVVYDHWNNSIAYWNNEVMDALKDKGITVNGEMEKAFTVMHIQGYHYPYDFDANGKKCEETTPLETQKGLNLWLSMYFDELKEAGIYDDATIIITADHGQKFEYYEPQPIFFIKLKNQKQDELEVNSAPISHDDILPTILDVIDKDYSKYGTSIFDWKEGDKRVREDCFSLGDKEMYIFSYSTDETELLDHMKNMEYYAVPTR